MKISSQLWLDAIRRGLVIPPISADTPWPEAVSIVIAALAQHLKNSEHVRAYLMNLEKGSGTSCPDSPIEELIKYVAEQNGQIDKTDPVVNGAFIEKIVFPVFELQRQCLKDVVAGNKDITYEEKELFYFSVEFAKLIDKLYSRWFEKLVVPYQQKNETEQATYCRVLKDRLGHFDYTVFDYRDGVITNRQTWAQAFPEETQAIGELLGRMSNFKNKEIREYFQALASAYLCTDIAKLEELWAAVDKAWIKIPADCRMFPVHGMENGYEHPYGVSPEYRLTVRKDYGQDMISETKKAVLLHAREIDIEDWLVELAKKKLSRMDTSVFSNAVVGGVCANFRYAGQVVPNRQDILAEDGKIFLDIDTTVSAIETYRGIVLKHCAPGTAEKLIPMITVDGMLLHTIAHEYTHPVGCTPKGDKALGDMKNRVEETKATLGGLAAVLAHPGKISPAENAALSTARICRFLSKATYENPTAQPYVRENLAMAKLLLDAEVVKLTPEGIVVNLEFAQLSKWQNLLQQFYFLVVAAYQKPAPKAKVSAIEKLYCAVTPEIQQWIEWVNR